MKVEFSEQCNYFKTSKAAPDMWFEKTENIICEKGGEVLQSGFGNEPSVGRAAYMLRFSIKDAVYKIIWPVLPSENGEKMAARRQAATMLFHDVKAKLIAAQVLGSRIAFFQWVELPNGQPACQLTNTQLLESVPKMFLTHNPQETQ